MTGLLQHHGLESEIADYTPNLDREFDWAVRGNEIYKWMLDNIEGYYPNYAKNYVIIDDDTDMLYWQRKNFVNTNFMNGLTAAHMKKAIKILNNEFDDQLDS